MADIFTPSGVVSFESVNPASEPRQSTLIYLRQFARAYSPLFGGFILN